MRAKCLLLAALIVCGLCAVSFAETAEETATEIPQSAETQQEEFEEAPADTNASAAKVVQWVHGVGMFDVNDSIADDYDWARDCVIPLNGMPIPQLYQYNYGDPVAKVGGRVRSPKTSGCGATSLSMVAAYITGNTLQTPHSVFRFACMNGLYYGDGLSHDAMSFLADKLGLAGTWIGKDGDAVLEALSEGKPVIAHMGHGVFTRKGHYIVLRGIDENGKVLVNDPNSFDNSHLSFDIGKILSQTRTGQPFFVVTRKRNTEE